MRLTDIMAQEFPEPRWAVPSILPEGLTILAGKPKLGKSWLALNLALAIGNGGMALGSKQVEQGGVLYLALEDPYRRLKERAETVLAGDSVPEHVEVYNQWEPLDQGGAARLDSYLTDHPDTRLVIVDTFAKVKPRKPGKNSDSYADDYAAVSSLKGVADKHGAAVLVVHHLRKAVAEDPQDQVSGTTGLTGAADGVLILQRARGEHSAKLTVTGRDVEERELALTFNPDTCRWILEGDAIEHMTPERRRTLAQLRNGPRTLKDIAEALGEKVDTVKVRLHRMFRDGLVSQPERGVYALCGYKPQSLQAEVDVNMVGGAASQPTRRAAGQPGGDIKSSVTTVTNVPDVTTVTSVTSGSVTDGYSKPEVGVTVQMPSQPSPAPQSYESYISFIKALHPMGLGFSEAEQLLGVTDLRPLPDYGAALVTLKKLTTPEEPDTSSFFAFLRTSRRMEPVKLREWIWANGLSGMDPSDAYAKVTGQASAFDYVTA